MKQDFSLPGYSYGMNIFQKQGKTILPGFLLLCGAGCQEGRRPPRKALGKNKQKSIAPKWQSPGNGMTFTPDIKKSEGDTLWNGVENRRGVGKVYAPARAPEGRTTEGNELKERNMKKVIVFAIGIAVASVVAKPAFSQTDDKTAGVSVAVEGMFGLTPNKASLNLGSIVPGAGNQSWVDSIVLQARTNHNMPWTVTLYADPIVHSDGATTIPSNLLMCGWIYDPGTSGGGVESPEYPNFAPIATSASQVYASNVDGSENSADYRDVALNVYVAAVPSTQKSGAYSTTLHFQMADSF